MDCNKAESQLGAWQDGELNALTAGRLRRHVRHCPHCASEAATFAQMDACLRAAIPFGVENRASPPPSRYRAVAPALAVLFAVILVGAISSSRRHIVKSASNPVAVASASLPKANVDTKQPRTAPLALPVALNGRSVVASATSDEWVSVTTMARRKQYRGNRFHPAKRSRRPRNFSRLMPTHERAQTPVVTPVKAETVRVVQRIAPQEREMKKPETKEPEILIIASRTLTREEVLQQRRDAGGFIYIEAIPVPPFPQADTRPDASPDILQ